MLTELTEYTHKIYEYSKPGFFNNWNYSDFLLLIQLLFSGLEFVMLTDSKEAKKRKCLMSGNIIHKSFT